MLAFTSEHAAKREVGAMPIPLQRLGLQTWGHHVTWGLRAGREEEEKEISAL